MAAELLLDTGALATLVVLAEELGTNLVFTTDLRDFDVYRIQDKRRFQILPE